jgi:hypothetical protein
LQIYRKRGGKRRCIKLIKALFLAYNLVFVFILMETTVSNVYGFKREAFLRVETVKCVRGGRYK